MYTQSTEYSIKTVSLYFLFSAVLSYVGRVQDVSFVMLLE